MKLALQLVLLSLAMPLMLLISGCASAVTAVPTEALQENPPVLQPLNNDHLTIAELEQLAGFDVFEPAYLPKGVSFDFAAYQTSPSPTAILHFKIVHEVYGDMGAFLQIVQEPQAAAPPDINSCGQSLVGCEILSIGDKQVVYRLNAGGTEGLDWYADGFGFRLLRTAGEPNKVYRDELISVVESMK